MIDIEKNKSKENRIKPISPNEVIDLKRKQIPDEVLVVFNRLIAEKWNGINATVEQELAIEQIKNILPEDVNFSMSWLDIEEIYKTAGWDVVYEKPGYNEIGKCYFIFKKKNEPN